MTPDDKKLPPNYRSPFDGTPLAMAILTAFEAPTLANIEAVARTSAERPGDTRYLVTPSLALNWFMRQVAHEPTCNIHTRERPGAGCSCPFGPCYAALSRAIHE